MKKIDKYISMVALGALTMVFNACTDECEREASPVQTDGITAILISIRQLLSHSYPMTNSLSK